MTSGETVGWRLTVGNPETERSFCRFLSFDLKRGESIRNKALRWDSLTRILSDSTKKPKIHLLLGVPSGDQRKEYGNAKDILNSSRLVKLIEEDEAADFARDLESRVKNAALTA